MGQEHFLRPKTSLFHVTSFENWASIQEVGLWPAASLIEAFVSESERNDLGLKRRTHRCTKRVLLEVDRVSLVHAYSDKVQVADINTGAAKRVPPKRWHHTFCALENYSPSIPSRYISELTVVGSIPDFEAYVRSVTLYDPRQESPVTILDAGIQIGTSHLETVETVSGTR